MNFSNLGLHPLIVKALDSAGYKIPTPVQMQSIPAALQGADLLVSSQTGSGKTAAFMLPSLQRLLKPAAGKGKGPRILVLTPTRELALQVLKAAETYGNRLGRLNTAGLVGGAAYGPQLRKLEQPLDVVVATPGRLLDHMENRKIDFSRLETLILDEADRMLDMGFIDDIRSIVARTPETRQTLLFSATLDGVVGRLAQQLTRAPQRIEIESERTEEAHIEQRLLYTDNNAHKIRLLETLLKDSDLQQAVVFTATKRAADELTGKLNKQGFNAAALHGNMRQNKRNQTLQGLRKGKTQVLVATDVAARGIDVAGISHVINYDAPKQAEDYVHRIGRTGRAGRSGKAITFVEQGDKRLIREIERFTGQSITIDVIPGLEPIWGAGSGNSQFERPVQSKHRPARGRGSRGASPFMPARNKRKREARAA